MQGQVAQLVEQWTENPCVGGSTPSLTTKFDTQACNGQVAQLVEQWTENPCVGGSTPSLTTKF